MTVAGAEFSGANAQQGVEVENTTTGVVAEDTMPVFVTQEIVQPVPEPVDPETIEPTPSLTKADSLRALVAQTDTDYELSREMRCLAGTVYFESRGEPLAGQLAVAQVVINRSESRKFPESYCGVVYQRSQFSFVKNGTMPKIKRGSTAWKRAKAIARIAHEGDWVSEAADALYFHANYVRPRWSRNRTQRARIKTHVFYR
ncbi:MAG: cell wall hydrolase [Pontixanthobacter sp.]